jgi:hypothetical protein
VCRSSCRAWSTCEGVRVKMRESGRANKAERPVRSPWDRKWERLSWESAARAFARALTSESQPEHACTRAGSVGCRSHPCIRGTPTVSRSVSRFRRGPPALTTPAERVSRDGCPLPSVSYRLGCTGLDESYLSERLSSNPLRSTLTLNYSIPYGSRYSVVGTKRRTQRHLVYIFCSEPTANFSHLDHFVGEDERVEEALGVRHDLAE